jgi:methylase of polypeptide subunit release factors
MTTSLFKLSGDKVLESVDNRDHPYSSTIEDINLFVHPHVYPSEKFRTTAFVLRSLRNLFKDKSFCDMGCGPGIMGLYALKHGATRVVQSDINPYAVENAKANNELNGYGPEKVKVYHSNCFDKVPKDRFDILLFNMPFHKDKIDTSNPLSFAFYDPEYQSVTKFLEQAKNYSHEGSEIYISFSNKGDVNLLESIFISSGFNWELWKIINENQEYDNRIYKLTC